MPKVDIKIFEMMFKKCRASPIQIFLNATSVSNIMILLESLVKVILAFNILYVPCVHRTHTTHARTI